MFEGLRRVWMGLALAAMVGLAGAGAAAQATGGTVLAAADTTKLLPASVWFKGQAATTQLRNSGGVKFSDGMYLLATLVDTSGYSSDVQEKYQAYFIAEVPIKIEGHTLAAGVYGVGFIAGNRFDVLDVGAHELFTVSSHHDAEIKRPMPLKVVADGGSYRLYVGRNYVEFAR